MNRHIVRLSAVCGAALAGLLLPGCNTVEGGGFVLSATGAGKATFGFSLACDGDTGTVSGEMVYLDHPLGLKAHLVPTESALTSGGSSLCGDTYTPDGDYYGDYTPSPPVDREGNVRAGGRFHVVLHDGGEPGPSKGDRMSIEFFGGVFGGYRNSRPLLGGNIDRVE